MPPLAKKTISTAGGGPLLGPASTNVLCEGFQVSLVGDAVTPHGVPPHNSSNVTTGSVSVLVNGIPPAAVGSGTSCGHLVANGAATVFINS